MEISFAASASVLRAMVSEIARQMVVNASEPDPNRPQNRLP